MNEDRHRLSLSRACRLFPGSTHTQVDEYSRRRTEEISEAVAESIKKVVTETQHHQQQLLADANSRTAGSFIESLFVVGTKSLFLF